MKSTNPETTFPTKAFTNYTNHVWCNLANHRRFYRGVGDVVINLAEVLAN